MIEAPEIAGEGILFLNIESLREAQPHLQHLLNNQLRFLVKVVARVRLAETVVDPDTEEASERYTDVWIPLGPWPVSPLARTDERFRRYILREADSRLQFALQESNYAEDIRKRVVGVRTLIVLAGTAALTANIPAPAGLPRDGGCYQQLPEHLRFGEQGVWNPKNMHDHRCFEYCIRAHVADVGRWSAEERKQAALLKGLPFFDEPAPKGRGAALRDFRKMVDIGLDFSVLPTTHVSFEDIDNFEGSNPDKVGVFVYEPMSVEWSVLGPSTVRPLREPSVEKPYEHEVILLVFRNHYSLIYNFSQTSSLRSKHLPDEMRKQTCCWHTCPRCQRNMKTEESLKQHLRRGLCNASPEERSARPNIRLAASEEEAKLHSHYKPASSAEWAELVVTADFEVFQENALKDQDGNVIAKQHEVASTCYLAKGRCGYEVPEKHLLRLDRCKMEDRPFDVITRFLRNLLDLAFDHLEWCRNVNLSPFFKPGELESFNQADSCKACGAQFGAATQKVLHHRHGTGEFLAALCTGCNSSIRRRKVVPVFFHNGGGFDFHYLIRAIAHLRQEEPEIKKEDSDDEAEGVTEEELERLIALDDCDEEPDYEWKKVKFSVLVKSGERYLQVRLGPLVFLDSCNIFPASLDALIADLRSTEKDPAEAFPLLAKRHPLFANAELFKEEARLAHPVFAKMWKKNCTFYREQVWNLLLQKLPMPFERMAGPECWEMDPVMPDRSCYNSRLTGEVCSEAKYEEIQKDRRILRLHDLRRVPRRVSAYGYGFSRRDRGIPRGIL